jgi:pyruvate formate lyase activating enzyme
MESMQVPLDNSAIVPTRYWHTLPDGRAQCDLCPRFCKLRDGQRGMCFVRANRDGRIVLTTYGLSTGFCIDPIEKKPLFHFLPGTPVLSFGTAGCNLACRFCQNWDISKAREVSILSEKAAPLSIAREAQNQGCKSVAFTYNDPVIFLEYAVDTAQACHERGIRTVAVTAGEICKEPREEFFRHMDAANIDLKAFTESFYHRLCAGWLKPVLETLEYVRHETNCWLEITNLIIPGENDAGQEINAMTRWVVDKLGPDVPMHFTAFHPDWKLLDHPPTSLESLQHARSIALANGVRYAYTGNVADPEGSTTYCHACRFPLVKRWWHEVSAWNLTDDGRCRNCGTACAGRFEGHAGTWGNRRQPVRIPA